MKKKLLMIITIIKVALLASALFLVSCSSNSTTGPSEEYGQGVISFEESEHIDTKVYKGVSSMTCTLEVVEENGKSTTNDGICSKNNVETKITFEDKPVDPNVSADLIIVSSKGIEKYSKAEDVVRDNPTATTKVSRENNVWEGKITDGGTDLLKLIIKTQDKEVTAPAGSKPCKFLKKEINNYSFDNYTAEGNCVLTYDTDGTTVTDIDFTSSLANPPVTASFPVGSGDTPITEDNQSLFKDVYRIGSYLYETIDFIIGTADPIISIVKNPNNNIFNLEFKYAGGEVFHFDIELTDDGTGDSETRSDG